MKVKYPKEALVFECGVDILEFIADGADDGWALFWSPADGQGWWQAWCYALPLTPAARDMKRACPGAWRRG